MRVPMCDIADKATPCNLTNHAYWNLSGNLKAPIHGHQLTIPSKAYLPVDDTSIPTGELKDVAGIPLELIVPHSLCASLSHSHCHFEYTHYHLYLLL